jgi:hypothetical protein
MSRVALLEFCADPASPYCDKAFDRSRPITLYCASGGRSALFGKALKEFGYERVYNPGRFMDWAEARSRRQADRGRHVGASLLHQRARFHHCPRVTSFQQVQFEAPASHAGRKFRPVFHAILASAFYH